MAKISLKKENEGKSDYYTMEKVKRFLDENNAGYILLTCSEPSENGNMNVEMSFEGDDTLVAYLADSAQSILDEQIQKRQLK